MWRSVFYNHRQLEAGSASCRFVVFKSSDRPPPPDSWGSIGEPTASYGLADRARTLGWTDVTVIDDDLGRSGSGISRPGFERLLAAICEGRVGSVFAIEASRLARNGRDWHTLIEFCGLVGTIIVDEDGVYDPRHPNDRL